MQNMVNMGRHHLKKHVLFQALPELANPIGATCSSFFWCQKPHFARMAKLDTNDGKDSWNDNYDTDDSNFDDYDEKNDHKTYKLYDFWVNIKYS